jgi:hypothetical protein
MYSSRVSRARVSDRIEEFLEEGASVDRQVGLCKHEFPKSYVGICGLITCIIVTHSTRG